MAKGKVGLRHSKKFLICCTVVTFLLCSTVTGTVAWLVSETEPVVNTFTYGDINIDLTETNTGNDTDDDLNTNTYSMLPGNLIDKDPTVTVSKNSEDCWLFVKIEESANFDDFMEYEMAEGWIALGGVDGVYYREVEKSGEDAKFSIIKDNKVMVKDSVTKEMLNALDSSGSSNYPTLTATAYAVQRDATIDTVAKAWSHIVDKE